MSLNHLPLFNGRTVLLAASGPSVVDLRRHMIPPSLYRLAVKDAWLRIPQPQLIYACDWRWWDKVGPAPNKYPNALKFVAKVPPDPGALNPVQRKKLETLLRIKVAPGEGSMIWEGEYVRGGWNSAFQIVNAIARRGVKRILMIGVDCDAPHSYAHGGMYEGQMPQTDKNVEVWLKQWRIAAKELGPRGIEVVNIGESSKVDAFPKLSIREAFEREQDESFSMDRV